MKRGFTLIEIIMSIVIVGILSAGILVAIKNLYIRAAKSTTISSYSMTSQLVLDSLSSMLYNRVPSTLIGYNPSNGNFKSVYLIDNNFTVLEWIGMSVESFDRRDYSGFVDLDKSNRESLTLASYDINKSAIDDMLRRKFGSGISLSNDGIAVIFAGSFDTGGFIDADEFNDSFGWHGNNHSKIYTINDINESNITLDSKPDEIYEKYYFVDSAYAVARGADIDKDASCIKDLNISSDKLDSSLFLFFNYRPWKGETFCADPNGSKKDGNVTLLLNSVKGFEAGFVNDNIFFQLSMDGKIKGSQNRVKVSKQKVIF